MKFRARYLALSLFAACLASALPIHAVAKDGNNQSAAKLKRLKAEIKRLNANVAQEISRKHRLAAELGKLEQRIGAAHRELTALAAQEKKLTERTATLDRELQASQAEAAAARQELSQALRAAFILGREPRVKLALDGEDPARAARLIAYYGYYSRARAGQIAKLSATIAHYQKLQDQLLDTQEQLARTEASRQTSLKTLEKSHTERQALVAKLNHDIAGKHARIASLERDAKRLERVIRSVNRDLAETPSKLLNQVDFAKLRGKLPWPVAGKVVNRFGSSRADDGALSWEAVRIAAPAGTRVHAIAYGRVAYAGWLPYYGLVLMVDHGDGYLTVYGHNEALYKQVGDWVKAGDVIATVGQSGGQPRPLLYFQIRHGNHPLNPARWCGNGRP